MLTSCLAHSSPSRPANPDGLDHRIGFDTGKVARRLAVLGLLGEDTHAAAIQILDQPGMMNIQPVGGVSLHPAMPSQTGGLAGSRRNEFGHLGFDRKAEGCEAEASLGVKLRTGAVVEDDVGGVLVIGRPGCGGVEMRPDLGCRETGDDDLVGGKIVGEAPGGIPQVKSLFHPWRRSRSRRRLPCACRRRRSLEYNSNRHFY